MPQAPWEKRKLEYLHRLAHEDYDVLLVSLADKLHNARSILADYRTHGEDLWQRFNAGKKDQLWYYGELLAIFQQHRMGLMVDELERVLKELGYESRTAQNDDNANL